MRGAYVDEETRGVVGAASLDAWYKDEPHLERSRRLEGLTSVDGWCASASRLRLRCSWDFAIAANPLSVKLRTFTTNQYTYLAPLLHQGPQATQVPVHSVPYSYSSQMKLGRRSQKRYRS